MSISVTAVGKRNVDGVSGNEYIWEIENTGGSDVTYTWTAVGGETGSITLIAGATTFLYTNTLDDITITDGPTTIATGTFNDVNAPGTIKTGGAANVVYGHEGNDKISTQGGNDYLEGGLGNDTLIAGGGVDTVLGGVGNDSIKGGGGNDVVYGGAGDDIIEGQNGNDLIHGNAGADTITGGGGTDRYIYTDVSDSTAAATDVITDFVSGELIDLEALGVTDIGAGADEITITDNGTDSTILHNGSGFQLTVEGFVGLNAGHFVFVGGSTGPTEFDDNIDGSAGNDTIDALGGNDVVNGLGGSDSLKGGNGNDTLNGAAGNDTLDGGSGNDNISAGADDDLVYGRGGADNIDGGAGNDNLIGNGGNDTILGGAGNDILNGGNNDDVLNGGAGNDTLTGGNGTDTFIIDAEAGATDVILSFAPASTTDQVDISAFSDIYFDDAVSQVGAHVYLDLGNGQQVHFYNVNVADFTTSHFIGINAGSNPNGGGATQGDDVLDGTADADTIDGLGGNDTINGLAGADDLQGSAGNDTLSGGEGNDTLSGGTENDVLNGGAGDDVLNGDSGNDTLNGGAGNDTLQGGAGDDVYVIESNGVDADVITGFDTSTINSKIDLSDFGGGLYFEDLNLTQVGSHSVLDFGNGQTITMYNTTANDFTVDHFIGVQPGSDPNVGGSVLEGSTTGQTEATRLTSIDLGTFEIADWDGDGKGDIITQNGAYGQGVVWISGDDMSVNRVISFDAGNHEFADMNNDGVLDIVTDYLGGVGWYDGTDGYTYTRVAYNNPEEFQVYDVNGDGTKDIVANEGTYANGLDLDGAVWYDGTDGTMSRITYNDLGANFQVVDIDQDGQTEVVSSDGTYQNGIELKGLVYYELDGSILRHTFAGDSDFVVGNFDLDSGLEILTPSDAVYASGAVAPNAVVFQGGNQGTRFTYNDIGQFDHGDIDGDGVTDIISTQGSYFNGTDNAGIIRYNVDGSFERVSYTNAGDIHVADWDGDGVDDVLVTGGVYGDGLVELELNAPADDILVAGNQNDTLIGGGGDDTLTGSGGNDIFLFNNAFDHDVITDFGTGNDVLSFQSVTGVSVATDVISNAQVVGGDTVITIGNEGSITLTGFTGLEASDITIG